MRDDGDPDLILAFGCLPHVPSRSTPERFHPDHAPSKGPTPRTCPTCNGKHPEGSPLMCGGCHGVAPEHQARFDRAKVKADRTRQPERNRLDRQVRDKVGNRFVLTAIERAEIVAESESPEIARAWLDSIGQPPPTPAELRQARSQEKKRNRTVIDKAVDLYLHRLP